MAHQHIWRTILCGLIAMSIHVHGQLSCPDGWERDDDNCYWFSQDLATRQQARTNCSNMHNSHLVTVNTPEIYEYLIQKSIGYDIWIGIMVRDDLALPYNWFWSDGTPTLWIRWDSPGTTQACVRLANWDGVWTNYPCTIPQNYVCKKQNLDGGSCEEDWVGNGEFCYFYSIIARTNMAAALDCIDRGAVITSVYGPEENDFLQGFIPGFTWLGLYPMRWDNNQPYNWHAWDVTGPLVQQPCIRLSDSDGVFKATECGSIVHRYVCQRRASAPTTHITTPSTPVPETTEGQTTTSTETTTSTVDKCNPRCSCSAPFLNADCKLDYERFCSSVDNPIPVLLPDPDNCDIFHECNTQRCPNNMIFDPILRICTHNARCAPIESTIGNIKVHGQLYCPEGWEGDDDNCYWFSQDLATRQQAMSNCTSMHDSHLVTVNTPDIHEFLTKDKGVDYEFWIGIFVRSNLALPYNWFWSDGTPTLWTKWDQPGTTQACVRLLSSDGRWETYQCTVPQYFVCKKQKLESAPCEDNWTENNGFCYIYSSLPKNNMIASRYCIDEYGATLTSVYAEEENNFLQTFITNDIWIGLFPMRWEDNQRYNWHFWDLTGPLVQLPCVRIDLEGFFKATFCDSDVHRYVCQTRASAPTTHITTPSTPAPETTEGRTTTSTETKTSTVDKCNPRCSCSAPFLNADCKLDFERFCSSVDNPIPVLLPDPDNCDIFHECNTQRCPHNMIFDPILRICTHNARCAPIESMIGNIKDSPCDPVCRCALEFMGADCNTAIDYFCDTMKMTALPEPGDCHKYYVCESGEVGDCGEDLFDHVLQECVSADDAKGCIKWLR